MVKIPDGKTILYVYIDRDLDKRLRELIIKKYGEYRKGLLSAEVEAALYAWISTHKSTQSSWSDEIGRVNPLPRYYSVWRKIKKRISEEYGINFNEVHQVPARFLRKAIEDERGSDPRTVRKWLRIFTEHKLIKWITPELVEVLG